MHSIRIATALAALFLTAIPATAQREETFRWSGALAAGRTLEVRGMNGSIEARPSSGRSVEVVAVKQGEDDDPRQVHSSPKSGVSIRPSVRRGRTGFNSATSIRRNCT